MSIVRELVTKLTYAYDNSGLKKFVDEVKQARKATATNVADIKSNLGSLKGAVLGYFGMIAGGSVMQIADEWASVSGRVQLATQSAEEHKHALEEIYNIAQRTGQTYAASGDLFQKVQRNAGSLSLNTDQTLKMTEIIGQTLTIGGGDAGSQQAALMQLGQALGSGVLRGEELNSIIEQAPRLAEAIASSFGIGVGQLKEMGEKGKLTAKELSQGLLKQAEKIQAEFDKMPKTFSFGMTVMKNAFHRWIAYAVNDVLNLGQRFYELSQWLEKNIKLVLILAASAIGAKLLSAINIANGGLKLLAKNALKAFAPFLAMTAVLAAIGLIIEDLYVWVNGGNSLAGDLLGDFSLWENQFQDIGKSLKMLWLNVKDFAKELAAVTGIKLDLDWDSWSDFAKSTLQYVIDGVKSVIHTLRSAVRFMRALFRGDFDAALSEGGSAIDGLKAKFFPLYAVALWALIGIRNLIATALLSPIKYVFFAFGWLVAKIGMGLWALAKPFWSLISFIYSISKVIFFIGKKAFPYLVRAFMFAIGKMAYLFGFLLGKAFLFARFFTKYLILALRTTGAGFMWLGRVVSMFVVAAVKGIWTIARAMVMAMVSNPILLAITLIIAAIIALIVYWDEVKAFAIAVWEAISTKAEEIWQSITQWGNEAWESIKTTLEETWEKIKTNTLSIWQGITQSIKNLWSGITDFFSTAWDNVINAVAGMFDDLIPNWVKNLFSKGSSVTINGSENAPLVSPSSAQQAQGRNVQVSQTQNITYNVSSTEPKQVAREVQRHQTGKLTFGIQPAEYVY